MKSLKREKCPVCGRWKMTYSIVPAVVRMYRHNSYQPSQNDPDRILGAVQWLPCPGSNQPLPGGTSGN